MWVRFERSSTWCAVLASTEWPLQDERFVLPALQRFNGNVSTTSDGQLIYTFPQPQQEPEPADVWLAAKLVEADVRYVKALRCKVDSPALTQIGGPGAHLLAKEKSTVPSACRTPTEHAKEPQMQAAHQIRDVSEYSLHRTCFVFRLGVSRPKLCRSDTRAVEAADCI
jgi:hypothetical protein